jgi:hypothetical protein
MPGISTSQPMRCDCGEQRFGLKSVDDDDRATAKQRGEAMVCRRHMKQRSPRDEALRCCDAEFGGEDQSTHDHGAVRDDGAFGQSGGPAGIEDHEPVFRLCGDGPAAALVPGHQPLILVANLYRGAAFRRQVASEIRLDDQQPRRNQIDAIGEFARRQAPVQACRDHAEIGGGELDLEVFGAIAREQGDTIAALQSLRGQHGGRTPHAV